MQFTISKRIETNGIIFVLGVDSKWNRNWMNDDENPKNDEILLFRGADDQTYTQRWANYHILLSHVPARLVIFSMIFLSLDGQAKKKTNLPGVKNWVITPAIYQHQGSHNSLSRNAIFIPSMWTWLKLIFMRQHIHLLAWRSGFTRVGLTLGTKQERTKKSSEMAFFNFGVYAIYWSHVSARTWQPAKKPECIQEIVLWCPVSINMSSDLKSQRILILQMLSFVNWIRQTDVPATRHPHGHDMRIVVRVCRVSMSKRLNQ